MNPLFRIDFSISDSLKIVRKSVLIYETIIKDEEISRFAALGVRCLRLDLNKFNELFDVDFNGIFKYEIELLKYYGYIEIDNGYLTVSKKGKFYIDNISKMFFSFNNRGKTQLWGCKLRKVKPSKYTTINEVKRRLYYGK